MNAWWRRRLAPLWQFHGTPHELALAVGLGVALGVLPGTGAGAAVVCATILRLNVPLAVAGSLLTNPLTAPAAYLGSYALGRWVLGPRPLAHLIPNVVVQTLAGGALLAVGLGIVGYLVALGVAIAVRARRWRK